MRFYLPEDGDRRVRQFFAIFPVRIGLEVRWLERVRVRQVFNRWQDCACWGNKCFVDCREEGGREE